MLNTAMCSHGNRLFRLDTVEAKGITPLITPTGIRNHLDAVARQPMSQGAAANSVPQLHPQREIVVKSEVGRYASQTSTAAPNSRLVVSIFVQNARRVCKKGRETSEGATKAAQSTARPVHLYQYRW